MITAIHELLLASSEVAIQASGKPPEVTILAYTGRLMSVSGWGPIAIEMNGIDASAEQVSLLADHDASLKGVVVASGKLIVEGTLTLSTEAAKQVIELA